MADAYELPASDFAHLRENMIKVTKDPEVLRKEVSTKRRGAELLDHTGEGLSRG